MQITILYSVISLFCISTISMAATFTVTNTLDSGTGSLRQAIIDANTNGGLDSIHFAIPGAGTRRIAPSNALPPIVDAVVIDGTTQPGYADQPLIELNGSRAGTEASGLEIDAGNSVIRGLVVNQFKRKGVRLRTGGGNRIEGCYIGTDATGASDLGNVEQGIYITRSHGNIIGGTTVAARNVISGNDFAGVLIDDSSTGNRILGNLIGLDTSGNVILSNSSLGIRISNASSNVVGGTTPGAGNVVSGNGLSGVGLDGGAVGNAIQGNLIGTDRTGTRSRANAERGIYLGGAGTRDNVVGGTVSGAGNVLAGNNLAGVLMDTETTGNRVQGNFIGTDRTATLNLGNGNHGVHIGAPNNFVGGVEAGFANIIAFNGKAGVLISSDAANSIRGNFIYSNGGLGIDLSASPGNSDGVTPNDPKDPDGGGNNLVNYPVLISALVISNQTWISGRLNTVPDVIGVTIDFYANDACDPSGYGEGRTYLGAMTVNTDEIGDSAFRFTLSKALPVGHFITATTTGTGNSTSEFSKCIPVHTPPALQIGYPSGDLELFWPAWANSFRLEETDTLTPPIFWRPSEVQPVLRGDHFVYTPQFPFADRAFYRLVEVE